MAIIAPSRSPLYAPTRPLPSPILRRASPSLLNLDCSSDLRTYSRSLGPLTQRPSVPIPRLSHDNLHRQHEDQRSILPEALRSHVPDASANVNWPPPSHPPPAPHQPPVIHCPQPSAPPVHFPMSEQQRSSTPDIATYPPALRDALEQSSRQENQSTTSTLYEVIQYTDGEYRGKSLETVAVLRGIHSANLFAAQLFTQHVATVGFEMRVASTEEGGLDLRTKVDESTDARVVVVEKSI